jgi:hypothetical protein
MPRTGRATVPVLRCVFVSTVTRVRSTQRMPKRRRAQSRPTSAAAAAAAAETDSKATDHMDIDAGDGGGGGGGDGGGGGGDSAAKKQKTSGEADAGTNAGDAKGGAGGASAGWFVPDSAELVTELCAVGHSALIPDVSAVVAAYAAPGPLHWHNTGGRTASGTARLSLPFSQCPWRIAMRLTFPPEGTPFGWRSNTATFEGTAPGPVEEDARRRNDPKAAHRLQRLLCRVIPEYYGPDLVWYPSRCRLPCQQRPLSWW